ncbi:MAG TPA: hypothetical protein ENK48_05275 [Gammaproteobacteria bacterium]|nr:hypothetical protein [Gammaproteobacteria bacterium]
MKDLKRLLVYGGSATAVIFFLSYLATSGEVSGNMMVAIAVLLVVVLPVVLMVWVGRRERARHPGDGG